MSEYLPSQSLSDACDEFAIDLDQQPHPTALDFVTVALAAYDAYVGANFTIDDNESA